MNSRPAKLPRHDAGGTGAATRRYRNHPEEKVDNSMANTRRATQLAAVGAAAALALAACGGGSGNDTPSASSASGFNAAVTGIVNAGGPSGGTLKLGALSDVDSYDPGRTYYAYSWDIQRMMTRTLMAFKAEPGTAGSELVPDMATEPGTSNADGTVWTYKIKSGIKFDDGTAVTTKDIKYGIERLFATDVINGGPGGYYTCLLSKCDAEGTPEYKGPYADPTGDLASIQTPDDSTIVFNLNKPFAEFNYLMAIPASGPVPKARDTKGDYQKKPASTGPFVIDSYEPNKITTFVRNKYWDQATDDVRKPKADTITITIVSDASDLDKRVINGDIDVEIDGSMQPENRAIVLADEKKKANADNTASAFTRYLSVMQTVPPLDNKACREAVFYAFNKADYVKVRGGSTGGAPANTMTPPGIPGHDDAYNPYPNGADFSGDLEKAKAKLAECGQPNGFTTSLAYANTGLGPKLFASIQQNLARVGIKVNGAPASQDTYYTSWIGSPANIKDKGIGIAIAAWGPDYNSAFGFWSNIADGRKIIPQGNTNYPSLNDPAVNKDLDDLLVTTDVAKYQEVATKLDQDVMNNAVYLPVQYDKIFYYRSPRLTDIYLNQGLGYYYDLVQIGVGGK